MTEATCVTEPFAMIPRWVLRDCSISLCAKTVYGLLASYADADGVCWPSQATLAAHAGVAERTVRRALLDLEALGLIEVDKPGRRKPNRYKVGGHQRPTTEGWADKRDRSDRTPETYGDRTPETYEVEPVELEPVEEELEGAPAMRAPTTTPTPMTFDWQPEPSLVTSLESECGVKVDVGRQLRRFRNYHVEKGTRSRAWDAKFETWILSDLDRAEREERATAPPSNGPDEFGNMKWQHRRMDHPASSTLHPGVAAALAKVIELDKRRPA